MLRSFVFAAGLLAAGTFSAAAAPIEFSGSSGGLSAKVSFEISGTNLIVTLSNVGAAAQANADLLTGVYFQLSGNPALTKGSVVVASDSTVVTGATLTFPAGTVVGGEFGFVSALGAPFTSPSYGISSSGLGLFGPGDVFAGGNLAGPVDPDGPQYGILPAAGFVASPAPALLGIPVIKNKVVVTLGHAGAISSLTAADITNVQFQYGTSLTEPRFGATCTTNCNGGGGPGPGNEVPAPASMLLLGAALAGLGLSRARRT